MTAPRLVLLALVFLCARAAHAAPYTSRIEVEDEDDLYELRQQDLITEAEFETLLELFETGVNLETAGRDELYELPNLTWGQVDAILEYRRVTGHIGDPAALVNAGILTPEELEQIAPFLIISDRREVLPVSGKVELQTRYTVEDQLAPPLLLRTDLKLPRDFRAAIVATSTRFRPGPMRYDPVEGRLVADDLSYRPQVPKFFLQWKTPQRQVTVGTFRIGFGESLTLDTTSRLRPNGAVPDKVIDTQQDLKGLCRYSNTDADRVCEAEELNNLYNTPDWSWREGFRGVAGSVEDLALSSDARLALHGFGSFQSRSVYQNYLYDRTTCDDPRGDCDPLPIYADTGGLENRRFKFTTFPAVFNEVVGGGNATLVLDERIRFGVTGYYAAPLQNVDGAELDNKISATRPFGGPFGAIGLMGSTVAGPFQLSAEAARSFDSIPSDPEFGEGGGGFGVVQRTVWSRKKREATLWLRYYDRLYANPFARPPSAPNSLEGNRARDELGARLLYVDKPNDDWRLRIRGDLASDSRVTHLVNAEVTVRGEFVGYMPLWKAAAWVYHRRGSSCIVESGFGDGDDVGFLNPLEIPEDEGSFFLNCGTSYRAGARAQIFPFGKKHSFAAQYQHTLGAPERASATSPTQQNMTAFVEAISRPLPILHLKLRTALRDEDVFFTEFGERIWWTYGEVSWLPTRRFRTRVRYDLRAWIDERENTLARRPNPEHRLRLILESRF